jgi:hypothetical protein
MPNGRAIFTVTVALLCGILPAAVRAQTLTTLYAFAGGADGDHPGAGSLPIDERNGDAEARPGSPTKTRNPALTANGRRVLPASGALGTLGKRSA